MGYNVERYNTSASNNGTENLSEFTVGEDFTATFPWGLSDTYEAGVKIDVSITESVDFAIYGYEQGSAERDTIVLGSAAVD